MPTGPQCKRRSNWRGSSAFAKAKPQHLTVLLLAALAILYAGWLIYVIAADRPLDFYVYYMAGETFARGGNAYTISDQAWDKMASELGITNYTRPYRYPPHTAVLLTLFHPLGPHGAMVIWVIVNAVAMMGGAWLLGQSQGGGWWLPVSLALLLLFVPPLATLLAGQVNGLLFFSVALALWGLTRREEGWLGTGLALGAALKVIPLALMLYLFWRRQWRAGLIAVAVLLALTLACLPVIGWEGIVAYGRNAILLGEPNLLFASPTNQTITATIGRLLPSLPTLALTGGHWLGLLLVVVTAALCWPVGDAAQLMPLEFGLIVVTLHMIPPFSWYHQLVLLFIPLLIVTNRLWGARQWAWLGLLAALFVLTDLHGLAWHYLERWPWLTFFPFLLELTLWATLAWLIVQKAKTKGTWTSPRA